MNDQQFSELLETIRDNDKARIHLERGTVVFGDKEYTIGKLVEALWCADSYISDLISVIEDSCDMLRQLYPDLDSDLTLDEMLGLLVEVEEQDSLLSFADGRKVGKKIASDLIDREEQARGLEAKDNE